MTHAPFSLAVALLAIVGLNEASAQPTQVFVAAQGSDSNPCTLAQPCLTFQHAHDTVAPYGEIDALNTADYGPIYITKSLSIIGFGMASVQTPNQGVAITIDAGEGSVFLSGLNINGGALVGQTGIGAYHAENVKIVNCVVRNMQQDGITVKNITYMRLLITDTLVTNNNFGSGINLSPQAELHATLNRVTANSNGEGLTFNGGGASQQGTQNHVSATNSVFSNNSNGVGAYSGYGLVSLMNVTVAENTRFGIFADSGGTISIGRSLVAGNGYGATANGTGSTIFTQGDNAFLDNSYGDVRLTGGTLQPYTLK
jgi:hypothetical protein